MGIHEYASQEEKSMEGRAKTKDGKESDLKFHEVSWNTGTENAKIDLAEMTAAEPDLQLQQIENWAAVNTKVGIRGYAALIEKYPGDPRAEEWDRKLAELKAKSSDQE